MNDKPSRIDQIKARILRKTAERKDSLTRDRRQFTDHPLLYTALIASGFLSALAGLAIGLGLRVVDGNASVILDLPHIFFALLYAFLFPFFFEYGLANWLDKHLLREPENRIQYYTSMAMVALTFIGTAVTAFSAMDVLVTTLGFFDSFTEIPAVVQRWIAFSLPTMFLLNIAAGELYRQFSSTSILKREAEMDLRETEIEANHEVTLAQMDARKQVAIAQAGEYSRQVSEDAGAIGTQKGRTLWSQDKQDMTGQIQNPVSQPTFRSAPQPILRRAPLPEPSYHPRNYTLQQFLDLIGYTKEQAQGILAGQGVTSVEDAWLLLLQYQMIPLDMVFDNFKGLYAELFPPEPYPAPAPRVRLNGERGNP